MQHSGKTTIWTPRCAACSANQRIFSRFARLSPWTDSNCTAATRTSFTPISSHGLFAFAQGAALKDISGRSVATGPANSPMTAYCAAMYHARHRQEAQRTRREPRYEAMTSLIAQADDVVGSTQRSRADRRQSEAIQMSEKSPMRGVLRGDPNSRTFVTGQPNSQSRVFIGCC
jgi:hypothetical protein